MLKIPNTITVDNLTATIRSTLISHPALTGFVVTGELRELKKHTSGHVYFTLLGENSRVSCAIFKGYANRILQHLLLFVPKHHSQSLKTSARQKCE